MKGPGIGFLLNWPVTRKEGFFPHIFKQEIHIHFCCCRVGNSIRFQTLDQNSVNEDMIERNWQFQVSTWKESGEIAAVGKCRVAIGGGRVTWRGDVTGALETHRAFTPLSATWPPSWNSIANSFFENHFLLSNYRWKWILKMNSNGLMLDLFVLEFDGIISMRIGWHRPIVAKSQFNWDSRLVEFNLYSSLLFKNDIFNIWKKKMIFRAGLYSIYLYLNSMELFQCGLERTGPLLPNYNYVDFEGRFAAQRWRWYGGVITNATWRRALITISINASNYSAPRCRTGQCYWKWEETEGGCGHQPRPRVSN